MSPSAIVPQLVVVGDRREPSSAGEGHTVSENFTVEETLSSVNSESQGRENRRSSTVFRLQAK